MAKLSVESIMDRVSLVIDCENEAEAAAVYNILASQLLDGKSIRLNLEHEAPDDDKDRDHIAAPQS